MRLERRWHTAIYNPSERLNVAGAFTWQIDPGNQLFLTGTYARN